MSRNHTIQGGEYESLDLDEDMIPSDSDTNGCLCAKIDSIIAEPRSCRRKTDYLGMVAAAFLVIGVIAIIVGYLIPRHSNLNPDLTPAREYEKIETYYATISKGANISIMIGLVFLGIGGVIMSALLTWSTIENCRRSANKDRTTLRMKAPTPEENREASRRLMQNDDAEQHYGTTE